MGDGTTTTRLSPVLVPAPPGVTFLQVAAGGNHSCAVTAAGAAYCWGVNGVGQLGDETMTDRLSPVLVTAPAGVTFTQVAAGSVHSCGMTAAETVNCWGEGSEWTVG